jgi:hypothetical protein
MYTHYYLVAIFVPHSVKSHQITSVHSQSKAALYNRNITLAAVWPSQLSEVSGAMHLLDTSLLVYGVQKETHCLISFARHCIRFN